jgi:hypothetical protein
MRAMTATGLTLNTTTITTTITITITITIIIIPEGAIERPPGCVVRGSWRGTLMRNGHST